MAVLESLLQFTGSLDNLSFYKLSGSGKIVVRRKGGPSRKQVLKGRKFENTRLNAKEFAGRVLGSQMILRALLPVRRIFNYNVALALHKPLRAIQVLDPSNGKGRRAINLSLKPSFIEGFNLNTRNSLDSVIRTPIEARVSPEGRAVVRVPELVPGVNLMLPEKYPYYRIVISLAAVPDLLVEDKHYVSAVPDLSSTTYKEIETPWISIKNPSDESAFELTHPMPVNTSFVWMLSLGIQVGFPSEFDDIRAVKKQGAGKILKVVPAGKAEAKAD